MGLISWIKTKYYNHKLSQADQYVENRDFSQATLIYESLLGKQPLADAHFARMLVDNASSVSEKLDVLKRLLELRQNVSEESKSDFNSTLNKHVSSIETLASTSFDNGRYLDSVNLLSAIRHYKSCQAFDDKLNKYNAYLSFEKSERDSLYSPNLFGETVRYLNQISNIPDSDIKQFLTILEKQHKYHRGIKLSTQFLSSASWVKDTIIYYVVEIISDNDSETKKITALKDICSDKSLCKYIANDLSKRAREKAQKKDYKTAVKFVNFAADYLSDDNSFNFERCKYIIEELSSRADVKEIKYLQALAKSLKLSDVQIKQLDNRVREIAVAASPANGIAICQLYIGQSDFDKVYLEKALSIAKYGRNIDLSELRSVVKNQTNGNTLPNVLGSFVPYLPALEKEFVDAAIIAIKSKDSTELLDKYWNVKSDTKFITSLITNNFKSWGKFATYIEYYSKKYLKDKDYLDTFCESVNECGYIDFSLNIIENLLKKKSDVIDYYIQILLKSSSNLSSEEEALILINRGIQYVCDDRLLLAKKILIERLIVKKNFQRAESEIISLLSIDKEAPTLLAEFYFGRLKDSSGPEEKYYWSIKVLDVNENHSLYDRFNRCLQESLTSLCGIAKTYCKSGDKEKAFDIADRLSNYWSHWIPLYIDLREFTKEPAATLNDRIKFDAETLKTIVSNCPSCKDYNSDIFRSLWNSYSSIIIRKSQSQPNDKAIKSLSTLKKAMLTYAPVSFVSEKEEEITKLIVSLKWDLANEYEHGLSFGNAIKLYDEVAADKIRSYGNRAELRSLICHVKANDVDAAVESRIYEALKLRSYQALREDLAFRLACYLLEHTRPSDAEKLLREFLPEEKALIDICESIYVKEAKVKLDEFNQLVKKFNDDKMSLAEATSFKASLRNYKKKIAGKLTDLSKEFAKFVPIIEAYILSKMFEEEAYKDILDKLMQENPNYIEDDTDFRNIAIASLGLIESDISDEYILKRAIAICLTAIYSDRLFVKSLDYTSWDDKYEFTLYGSLGQTNYDSYDDLPENVNFNSPIDNTNISIKDVQNSLLTRLEASVRKYHPELETFCNNEKDALDKIIELRLNKSYILASPQLCRTLASIRMSIENAFEYELEQDYGNREDVIALGCTYGFSGPEYSDYSKGYNFLLFCKSAISPKPSVSVASAFTADKVSYIKKYKRLASDLKSAVGTAMNTDIKDKMDFKAFLNKYEIICKTVGDTSLSLTCSNYVNGEVVHLLNDDKMELRDGVVYMVRLYNISPNHEKVKNNLEGILNNLVHKAEKDNLSSDRNALQKAQRDLNGKFDDSIALSTIIAKLSSKRIEPYTALSQLYNLYNKKKNDSEVCDALVAVIKLCIHKYFIGDSYTGKSQAKTVLNQLQNNRSATFKEKAKLLADEYLEIFKQLPTEAQILMRGGLSIGMQTLSSKGVALKEGLDYLKDLSDLDQLLKSH